MFSCQRQETDYDSNYWELFSILSSPEELAVKMAIEKINEKAKNELEGLIDEIDQIMEGQRIVDIPQFHLQISEYLFHLAQCLYLYKMAVDLREHIRTFSNAGYEVPGRMMESLHEHRGIFQAVLRGKLGKALSLVRYHIENSKSVYVHAQCLSAH